MTIMRVVETNKSYISEEKQSYVSPAIDCEGVHSGSLSTSANAMAPRIIPP